MPLAAAARLESAKDITSAFRIDEHTARVTMAILSASYAFIRFSNLQTFCLDTDEIFSLIAARAPLRDLLAFATNDVVHPPLFYLLLKGWIALGGQSRLWLRLFPCFLSIAALLPIRVLFRQYGLNTGARMLALAFLVVNDYQVFHARYLRMYALLFLLTLASLALFNIWLEGSGRKKLVTLTAVNLLLAYTHYFGWLVIILQVLFVALATRRLFKEILWSGAVVGILFAPWAAVVTAAGIAKGGLGPNLGWIRHPKLRDLLGYFAGCQGALEPMDLASLIFFLSVVLFAIFFWRGFGGTVDAVIKRRLRFAVVLALLPPVASFFVSNLLPNSVWGNRHLIISAVPYTILLSVAVTAIRFRWLRRAVICLFSGWIAWAGYCVTFHPVPRLNVETLVQQVAAAADESKKPPVRTVYCLDRFIAFPMSFYFSTHSTEPWNLFTIADPALIGGRSVWVAYNTKTWHGPKSPQETLRGFGYDIGRGVSGRDNWDEIVVFEASRRQKEERKQTH